MTIDLENLPVVKLPRERFELDCGGVLLVTRREGAPVTAVRAHFSGGAALDSDGLEGLAHLTGVLADQGTSRHSDEQLAELLEPEGGDVRGDALGLSGAVAGPAWKLLLEVLGELATDAAYPDELVAMQQNRLVTRLKVEQEDPRSQGAKRFRKLIFGEHHLGRATYGDAQSIARITPKDLRAHQAQHWCGKRLVMAVAGDLDPSEVLAHVNHVLKDLPQGTPYEIDDPLLPPRGTRLDVFERDRNQVHVYMGHLGITRANPDWVPLVVMDHILGTGPGFTSRITRKLRDELGLAYSVHADIHSSAGLLPGAFTAYIGTSPENLGVALKGFRAEIERIRETPVLSEELDTAKSYLLGSFPLGFERAARRAGTLVAAERHGFAEDHLAQLIAAYARVTIEDVQRVAQDHLFPDACVVSAAGPVSREQLESALS